MSRLIVSKLTGAALAVFGASLVAFVFLRALPGNPARLILGPLATPAAIVNQEHAMGLNKPLYTQYWRYVDGIATGNWGFSYSTGETVRYELLQRLPASIELGLFAFLFAFVGAVLLALLATYRRRRWVDGTIRGISFFGLGTPPFWFGLLVLLLLSQVWPIFPGPEGRLSINVNPPPTVTHLYTIDALIAGQWSTEVNALWHLVLPALTLGLAPFAFLVRLLRANLLDTSRENFIVVARGKGLGRWAAFTRHALPNAFLPTLTASGLLLAQLLAGSVLVEEVFDWPGVGQFVVNAVLQQDYSVVQTFVILSAIAYVVVNFVVDVLYGVIDPRVRIPVAR